MAVTDPFIVNAQADASPSPDDQAQALSASDVTGVPADAYVKKQVDPTAWKHAFDMNVYAQIAQRSPFFAAKLADQTTLPMVKDDLSFWEKTHLAADALKAKEAVPWGVGLKNWAKQGVSFGAKVLTGAAAGVEAAVATGAEAVGYEVKPMDQRLFGNAFFKIKEWEEDAAKELSNYRETNFDAIALRPFVTTVSDPTTWVLPMAGGALAKGGRAALALSAAEKGAKALNGAALVAAATSASNTLVTNLEKPAGDLSTSDVLATIGDSFVQGLATYGFTKWGGLTGELSLLGEAEQTAAQAGLGFFRRKVGSFGFQAAGRDVLSEMGESGVQQASSNVFQGEGDGADIIRAIIQGGAASVPFAALSLRRAKDATKDHMESTLDAAGAVTHAIDGAVDKANVMAQMAASPSVNRMTAVEGRLVELLKQAGHDTTTQIDAAAFIDHFTKKGIKPEELMTRLKGIQEGDIILVETAKLFTVLYKTDPDFVVEHTRTNSAFTLAQARENMVDMAEYHKKFMDQVGDTLKAPILPSGAVDDSASLVKELVPRIMAEAKRTGNKKLQNKQYVEDVARETALRYRSAAESMNRHHGKAKYTPFSLFQERDVSFGSRADQAPVVAPEVTPQVTPEVKVEPTGVKLTFFDENNQQTQQDSSVIKPGDVATYSRRPGKIRDGEVVKVGKEGVTIKTDKGERLVKHEQLKSVKTKAQEKMAQGSNIAADVEARYKGKTFSDIVAGLTEDQKSNPMVREMMSVDKTDPEGAKGNLVQAIVAMEERAARKLSQPGQRGEYTLDSREIHLLKDADKSTFFHEMQHHYTELTLWMAEQGSVTAQQDLETMRSWAAGQTKNMMDMADPKHKKFLQDKGDAWFKAELAKPISEMHPIARTQVHELVSRGYEQWLLNPKKEIPTERRSLFRRFTEYLKDAYRGLVDLRVTMSPEINAFFKRMLVLDAEIENMPKPLFMTQPKGMPDDLYQAYLEASQEARTAVTTAEVEKISDEVKSNPTEESDAAALEDANKRPEYGAINVLLDSGLMLNEADLEANASPEAVKWAKEAGIVAKDGVSTLDELAKIVGATDGKTLAGLWPPMPKEEWVQTRSKELAAAAANAMPTADWQAHVAALMSSGEYSMRLAAVEAKALTAMTREGVVPKEQVKAELDKLRARQKELAAAKDEKNADEIANLKHRIAELEVSERWASARDKKRVQTARSLFETTKVEIAELKARAILQLLGMTESQIKAQRYEADAKSESYMAVVKMAKNDFEAAGKHKQNELMLRALAGERELMLRDLAKANKRISAGMTAEVRGKLVNGSPWMVDGEMFATQVEAQRRADELNEGKDPALELVRPVSTEFFAKAADMLRGMYLNEQGPIPDTVYKINDMFKNMPPDMRPKLMSELLRESSVVVKDGEYSAQYTLDIADALDSVYDAALRSNKVNMEGFKKQLVEVNDELKKHIESVRFNKSEAKTVAGRVDALLNEMLRLSDSIRILDGDKEQGFFNDNIRVPLSDALSHLSGLNDKYFSRVVKAYAEFTMPERAMMMKTKRYNATNTLNRWEVIGTAMMNGSIEGRQRLEARGLDRKAVDAVLSDLTEKEAAFINDMFQIREDMKPEILSLYGRLGKAIPKFVEAMPYVTANGHVLQGGYARIKYEGDTYQPTAEDFAEMTHIGESVNNSYTISREKVVKGLRVDLEMDVQIEGMRQVLRDVALSETAANLWKFVGDSTTGGKMIIEKYGEGMHKVLMKNISTAIVGPPPATEWWQKAIRFLRNNMTIATLGFNVAVSAANILNYASMLGNPDIRRGYSAALAKLASNPKAAFEEMDRMSAVMRERSGKLNVDAADAMDYADGLRMVGPAVKLSFAMVAKSQRMTDVIAWHAAYEANLAKGLDPKAAADAASRIIEDVFGGHRGTALPAALRNDAMRLIMPFSSFTTAMLNTFRSSMRRNLTNAEKRRAILFAAETFATVLVPSIGYTLLKEMAQGQDDEDRNWGLWLGKESVASFAGMVPFGTTFTAGIKGIPGGIAALRPVEAGGKAVAEIFELAQDKGNWGTLVKEVYRSTQAVTPLSFEQFSKTLRAYANMDENPDDFADALRLLFGDPPRN